MRGDRVETGDWVWLDAMAGQQLFYPPNVSGWDETRWLDTSTFRARWLIARRALQKHAHESRTTSRPASASRPIPVKLVDRALGWWGSLQVSPQTRNALLDYARRRWTPAIADADARSSSR